MKNYNAPRLIACSYCGMICSGKSTKRTCGNPCAVKYHYARLHLFSTPYERYLESIKGIKVEKAEPVLQSNTTTKTNENNISAELLQNAKNQLTEINNLTNK